DGKLARSILRTDDAVTIASRVEAYVREAFGLRARREPERGRPDARASPRRAGRLPLGLISVRLGLLGLRLLRLLRSFLVGLFGLLALVDLLGVALLPQRRPEAEHAALERLNLRRVAVPVHVDDRHLAEALAHVVAKVVHGAHDGQAPRAHLFLELLER